MTEHGKILIVDDNEPLRSSLMRNLGRAGYSCSCAEDGLEAIAKLREVEFDVVLSDLLMPKMDGLALLDAIKEENLDVVPVILSGHNQISQAVEAIKRGAFDFIQKPTDANSVCVTVTKALKHREIKRHARAMSDLAWQWQATFDASPDMMVVLKDDQRILLVNNAMVERLGCSREDLLDRQCHEALCRDDHPLEDCPFMHDFQDVEDGSFRFSQQQWGGYCEINRASQDENSGAGHGCMYVIRDITARKRVGDELREARGRAERLIDSISSILICLDNEGEITHWNATAEECLGLCADDVIGKSIPESGITWRSDDIEAALASCLSEKQPQRVDDIRFVRPDIQEGFLSLTINPIMTAEGTLTGMLILGRDVTGEKFMETQLAQSQKLEGIGQLAAGIAHEINTPMQYIGDNIAFLGESFANLAQLVQKYNQILAKISKGQVTAQDISELEATVSEMDVEYLIEEIPNAIGQSIEGIERVTKIVRAMRDFSHPGVEEKSAIDINNAIESSITVCRNEWKYVADLETAYDNSLPPVPCLPGELNQVILNLIINAAHAIGSKADGKSEAKGTITVSTRRNGDKVEIAIRDTGCGIPEKCQARIFEPFFTTKDVGKGTGQGLAIARSVIVEKHDGQITFETEEGKGTTFTVTLPLVVAGPDQEASQQDSIQRELANV
ncbi:MAG TPA: response regulator [Phycisphaerae bacterium]|nr:response regulator [Phycisphaerae bacterium]